MSHYEKDEYAKDAYDQLVHELAEGEEIEAIVLGNWGTDDWYVNEGPGIITEANMGRCMSLAAAETLLRGWAVEDEWYSYKFYAWSNRRVFFLASYDGNNWIASVPRSPTDSMPKQI
jgi:hypothetical protein